MIKENVYGAVLKRVHTSFEQEKAHASVQMFTYRGLEAQTFHFLDGMQRIVEGYVDVLPTLEGKSVIELVDEKIKKKKEDASASDKPYEKVVITDLLYGKGTFLLDCRERWGDDVELVGIGSDHHTKVPSVIPHLRYDNAATLEYPPTYDALQKAGVRIIDGNVIAMRKLAGDNSSDIIVDCYGLMYVQYPAWEMVKKVYRTLRPDGIALLDYSISATYQIKQIQGFLQDHGYHFDTSGGGIAFRKTHSDIRLPLRTVNIGDPTDVYIEPFVYIGR